MIISRLTLFNFGIYAGKNTFVFHNNKPIVLIGGMNGRGKTTFLAAVLLALYGANSFAYNESRYKSYGQYLKSFVNKADGTLNTYVELEFKLDKQPEEVYIVNRNWSGKGKRIHEKISVKRNGEPNKFLTDNWSMFVENILPSGLSSFFFFEKKKIAELALDHTNAQMKESIKVLLGISVLDVLENDIARIVARVMKKPGYANEDAQELEKLKEKKTQAESNLHALDENIQNLTIRLEKTQKKMHKAKSYYASHGGDLVVRQQELFNQRAYYSASAEQKQEQLVNMAGGELPLNLVLNLIKRIQLQAKKEHETKLMEYALQKMNTMLDQYALSQTNGSTDSSSVNKFVSFVAEQAEKEKTTSVFDLSDHSLYQIDNLLSFTLHSVKKQTIDKMHERDQSRKRIDQLDSYLSVDIDEKSLAKTYKKMKNFEQEIIDINAEIEAEQKRRVSINGEVLRINAEYKKYVERLLSNLESNDDRDRLLRYAHQANNLLHEYRIRLQRQKIGILATTMTQCYKQLANKKNLINKIEMDDVTLDFTYYDFNGERIPNDSLSAGERQLMVISLLWALAKCSKKKLPVIIDTPLSRMDSNHRVSLITTYFPQASEQTIILSTDSEIDRHYYEIMKENVGDEFTLVYDDVQKRSVIKHGYFAGD